MIEYQRWLRWIPLIGLIGGVWIGPAGAALIFDNFGPGNDYQTHVGWTVSGSDAPLHQDWEVAMSFTPQGADYRLEGIEAAINQAYEDEGNSMGAYELDLCLMTSQENQPREILESWRLIDAGGKRDLGVLNPPVKVSSTLKPILSEGELYWVVVSGGKDTWAAWNYNALGDQGTLEDPGNQICSKKEREPWVVKVGDRGAFRVTGTPVDDSGMVPYLLFGLGVWSLTQSKAEERGIYRVPSTPVAIPEAPPSLLLGLGSLGMILWRRKSR